jgi:hypothetical protein
MPGGGAVVHALGHLTGHARREGGRGGVVDRGGVAGLVVQVELEAEGGGGAARDLLDPAAGHGLHARVEAADGAGDEGRLGDHVDGAAGMDLGHGDDELLHRVGVARRDGLERGDERAGAGDRVHGVVREGRMAALAA